MIIPGAFVLIVISDRLLNVSFEEVASKDIAFLIYFILFTLAYLIGLINNKIADLIFNSWFRNNWYSICCGYNSSHKIKLLLGLIIHRIRIEEQEKRKLLRVYYKAYYYVTYHPINSSIGVMEQQVAFIRNMLIPILLFLVIDRFQESLCVMIILLVVIALFFTMVAIKNKIYQRVWEDYEYLRRLEEQNKR